MSVEIRVAVATDADVILRFITELAEYEGEPHAVETSAERIDAELDGFGER